MKEIYEMKLHQAVFWVRIGNMFAGGPANRI